MPRTIRTITKPPKPEQKKRVAAYARVSSGKDAMLHSLSTQVSYYSELIQRRGDWIFVGVYADEAKTGTKEARENFQRLIADCRAGKIDMVITKSISRFARNTVTLLQTTREFKALGVDIFFEEQNIHTRSSDGELMMTILASYAQEESRSASENQRWRIRRNFEQGIPWNGTLLGYRIEDGQYTVVPGEADTVRRIFSMYLSGLSLETIAKQLNEDGIPTRRGGCWQRTAVTKVLSNYAYTGNLILQKTYRENYLSKQPRRNNGERIRYLVENTHEPIISKEMFQTVQEERERRARQFVHNTAPNSVYAFTGLLTCGICGKHYRRKSTSAGIIWICGTYNTQGKAACASKQIPENTLCQVTAEVLGIQVFSEDVLRKKVSGILVKQENTLVYRFCDGAEVTRIWKDRSRRESWTPEMREKARQAALHHGRDTGECKYLPILEEPPSSSLP